MSSTGSSVRLTWPSVHKDEEEEKGGPTLREWIFASPAFFSLFVASPWLPDQPVAALSIRQNQISRRLRRNLHLIRCRAAYLHAPTELIQGGHQIRGTFGYVSRLRQFLLENDAPPSVAGPQSQAEG